MDASEVMSLRCHLGRFAQYAEAVGAGFAAPGIDDTIDDALVETTAVAGGYLLTMWEIPTLYSLYTYPDFLWAYDELSGFVDEPSQGALRRYGVSAARLFASVATFKGVPETCGDEALLHLPGLVPHDAALEPGNAPEKVREAPRPLAPTPSRAFGGLIVGALLLGGGTIAWRLHKGRPALPPLPSL